MQQVTLNIPTEKMPAFRQFLHVLGNTENGDSTGSPLQGSFTKDAPVQAKFHPYYDWEFFMNELEYE